MDPGSLGSWGVALIRRPGSVNFDDNQITLRGAGAGLDVINQGYVGHVLWQEVDGDASITARPISQTNTATTDQVG